MSKQTMPSEQSSPSDRVVAVFWDVENIPLPKNSDVVKIGQELQTVAMTYGEVLKTEVITGSLAALNDIKRNALSHVGIDVIHAPVAKEAADKALIVSVLTWLWDCARGTIGGGRQPCVILITADHDFAAVLHKIRMRGVYTVLITRMDAVKQTLSGAADETLDFASALVHMAEHMPKRKKHGSHGSNSKKHLKGSSKGKKSGKGKGSRSSSGGHSHSASDNKEQNERNSSDSPPPLLSFDTAEEVGVAPRKLPTSSPRLLPPGIRRTASGRPNLDTVEDKVVYLLQQWQDGLPGHELPARYESMFGRSLKNDLGTKKVKKGLLNMARVSMTKDMHNLPWWKVAQSSSQHDSQTNSSGSSVLVQGTAHSHAGFGAVEVKRNGPGGGSGGGKKNRRSKKSSRSARSSSKGRPLRGSGSAGVEEPAVDDILLMDQPTPAIVNKHGPMAAPSSGSKDQWEAQHRKLSGMGFTDHARNIMALEKHKGNIEEAIYELLFAAAAVE